VKRAQAAIEIAARIVVHDDDGQIKGQRSKVKGQGLKVKGQRSKVASSSAASVSRAA
jgi:hypothetical protein